MQRSQGMTVVKTEPSTLGTQLPTPGSTLESKVAGNRNSRPGHHNTVAKADEGRSTKKQKYASYLLQTLPSESHLAGEVGGGGGIYNKDMLKSPSLKSNEQHPQIKKEQVDQAKEPTSHDFHLVLGTPNKDAGPGLGKSSSTKKRKGELLMKNLHATTDSEANISVETPTTPEAYTPITALLYDQRNILPDEATELFKDVEVEEEKQLCKQTAECSLQEWIELGQQQLAKQQVLMTDLIRERIEFSQKFGFITNIINERAKVLNTQGLLLEEKLDRIKILVKEILDII